MHMLINDNDIHKAEKIFLKNGQSFDEERINFIKCIDKSLHLQACPGSGKTTALLAKLYILSEKMPFEKNQGICVLTHTNVAIDIIKNKLGEKANRMFNHPNFFGTIQSFVDKYLAIPAYIKCFGYRPNYIDTEFFYNKILKYKRKLEKNEWLEKNKGNYDSVLDFVADINVEFDSLGENSFNLDFKIKDKQSATYKTVNEIIKEIFDQGYIRFKDAFSLSKLYLNTIPEISNIFSSRFKYVFIDEAQDTSAIQKEIIEKCFNENVIIQWIGDVNQGIMNDNYTETAWKPENDDKYELKYLSKSHRISQPIADVIKNVAISPYDTLYGCNNISIKPAIIVFDDSTKDKVLEKFAELVCSKKAYYNGEEQNLYDISLCSGNPIKAVGWVGKEKDNGLSIKSYISDFDKKSTNINKIYFPNLFTMCELSKNIGTKVFKNRTISCILEALHLSNVTNPLNNRRFNKTEFLSFINETDKNLLNDLLANIVKYYTERNFENFSKEIINCLNSLDCNLNTNSKSYLKEQTLEDALNIQSTDENNVYKALINGNKVSIPIDTVHGVKGETHTATLYLETKYYDNSSKYFCDELTGHISEKKSGSKRKNQALKIAHVAFSRPTHLLCISIHKSEYEKYYNNFSNDIFEIFEI
ncbi:MAG: ATP-dependent helicase UvrD/PcrA [Rikenellaceae bacterium]|nr:ATP-dependent helicase UvrD/PcrA [Rikenellaceae bacterium]MDN5355686.1 ATP-dependent helicase UvrD/PcrA [Rikenellaceae bacterium]